MIRGIQSAASGMMAQLTGQEAIANNLANAMEASDTPATAASSWTARGKS